MAEQLHGPVAVFLFYGEVEVHKMQPLPTGTSEEESPGAHCPPPPTPHSPAWPRPGCEPWGPGQPQRECARHQPSFKWLSPCHNQSAGSVQHKVPHWHRGDEDTEPASPSAPSQFSPDPQEPTSLPQLPQNAHGSEETRKHTGSWAWTHTPPKTGVKGTKGVRLSQEQGLDCREPESLLCPGQEVLRGCLWHFHEDYKFDSTQSKQVCAGTSPEQHRESARGPLRPHVLPGEAETSHVGVTDVSSAWLIQSRKLGQLNTENWGKLLELPVQKPRGPFLTNKDPMELVCFKSVSVILQK